MDGNGMYCKMTKKSASLLDLDDDILVWIFTRLPITTIIGCKRVCKSWYLFISSSYFANSYRANPPFTSLIISRGRRFSLIELNTAVQPNAPKILPNPFGSTIFWNTRLVGSCNGFLCFVHNDLVNIMNPLSGMSFMLPYQRLHKFNGLPNQRLNKFNGVIGTSYGFGFCPKTRQYKVVQIVLYGVSFRTELNIYTLGIKKSWRRLVDEAAPFPQGSKCSPWDSHDFSMQYCDVNGKGTLHWIVGKLGKVDYLYSFDISEEKVRPVPLPVGLKNRTIYTRSVFLHGCLCLLHMNVEKNIEFWSMKDYMVSDSWTLRIIPQTCLPGHMRYRWFHTVAVWENEEVLMALESNSLFCYNFKQDSFPKIKRVLGDTSPTSTYDAATCFVPNFLPFLEAGTAVGQTKEINL